MRTAKLLEIASFSRALDVLKESVGNKYIRRALWPNKNAVVIKAIYKDTYDRELVVANIDDINKFDDFVFGDGTNVMPFVPNSMDMLSADWEVYDVIKS